MSIREEAENERQKLKNMSWKDRAWYVWEYYKFHLLAVILVIGVLSTIGTMIYRQTFTTRLSVAISTTAPQAPPPAPCWNPICGNIWDAAKRT